AVDADKNEIIAFSDANTIFEKDGLKKLVRNFGDERVGCVCGLLKFISVKGSTSGELEGAYWRYETMLKKIEGARGSLLGANGAIFALRKNLFFKCPEDTIVEDFVVPMKILEKGYKVIYEPEAIAVEDAAKHIIQEKQRRIRIGAGDFQALAMFTGMLNPKKGFVALSFWSHKVLRWFVWSFMAAAFISNALLLNEPFYVVTFIAQVTFYMCAITGQMLSWVGIPIKFFNLCYYFVSMNLALFLGFINFISGRHTVKWDRTERE
ncbi:MAG: glycosyltransferase family 2 protein, partial [Nitrospinae bacterium]|nr:glycosyltransferase family 2 protein [Nitrospinota bacterium]